MKNMIKQLNEKVTHFWRDRTKTQKIVSVTSIGLIPILIALIVFMASTSNYVSLYNDLSLQEVGQIKEELDSRNISYELSDGGTTVRVPSEEADGLLVDLAALDIPDSGDIDYSFFSENKSWGTTEDEFDVMKLDATQTELSKLISRIDGIGDAEVMINTPEEPVYVSDEKEKASASIVIDTEPGYQFEGNQINSLYHLVSKAVPDLPEENIVIMNQYSDYYDQTNDTNQQESTYTYQQTVKEDTERDIQKRVQKLLGAMVGAENVIVSVTTDIDFTQEDRTEELVQPVDVEDMEGLPVSIERIQESYSGNPPSGGVAGTGDEDIDNYPGNEEGNDGDYDMSKETINNEFNRIRKDIVESPYKIRDLGIQVAVDNVKKREDDDVQYLTDQDEEAVKAGISSILNSMINTSINQEYGEVNPEEKTSIVFEEFSRDKKKETDTPDVVIPQWLYIAGGILLLIIILLLFLLIRNKRSTTKEDIQTEVTQQSAEPSPAVSDVTQQPESEDAMRKQLEKMAEDQPEEFAKLLRSWITEE